MRQLFIHVSVVVFMAALFVSPVFAAKIKHLGSVYEDNAELFLKHPEGVACNANIMIVADTGNAQLVRYSLVKQALTPEVVFPLPETSPIVAQVSSGGDIYVLDGKSRTIVKLSQDGQVEGKIEPQGLPGSKAFIPRSFKLDGEDNIYLLDIFAERVLVLSAAEKYLKQLPFPAGYTSFSDLAISPQGAIYLLDGAGGVIYVARPGSEDFVVLSDRLKEYMNFPTSIALDSRGDLYLSDLYGSGLVLVARDGTFQGRKFGLGWEDGQLYYPSQICINSQDVLAVADRNNSRVQVFQILED